MPSKTEKRVKPKPHQFGRIRIPDDTAILTGSLVGASETSYSLACADTKKGGKGNGKGK